MNGQTAEAIMMLRIAISKIYSDNNPHLTIHMMDMRAAKLRRAIEYLKTNV